MNYTLWGIRKQVLFLWEEGVPVEESDGRLFFQSLL